MGAVACSQTSQKKVAVIWMNSRQRTSPYSWSIAGQMPPEALIHPTCSSKGRELSDIPGDPGSQLPYQEFSPYYLNPIRLVFSHWRSSWVLGFAWVLFLSVLLATHIARG